MLKDIRLGTFVIALIIALLGMMRMWYQTEGLIRVVSMLGVLFVIPAIVFAREFLIELVRASWQSGRVVKHLRAMDKAAYEKDEAASKSKKVKNVVRLFLANLKHEFFANYTTIEIKGARFYYLPWEEDAYFKAKYGEEEVI